MATSSEIKARAKALAEKTDVNSITPKEVGGIMYDLASHSENVLRNGGTLGIRKVYESVSAMEADGINPVDLWGNPIKKGNLVVIYDGTTTGVDNNKVYAFMNPGWKLATELDAGYATKEELSELGSELGANLAGYITQSINIQYPYSVLTNNSVRPIIIEVISENDIKGFSLALSTGDGISYVTQYIVSKMYLKAGVNYFLCTNYNGENRIRVYDEEELKAPDGVIVNIREQSVKANSLHLDVLTSRLSFGVFSSRGFLDFREGEVRVTDSIYYAIEGVLHSVQPSTYNFDLPSLYPNDSYLVVYVDSSSQIKFASFAEASYLNNIVCVGYRDSNIFMPIYSCIPVKSDGVSRDEYIDKTLENIVKDVDSLKEKKVDLGVLWSVEGKMVRRIDGLEQDFEVYSATNYLPIDKSDVIELKNVAQASSMSAINFYNESKVFITSYADIQISKGESVPTGINVNLTISPEDIPEDTYYIRSSVANSEKGKASIKNKGITYTYLVSVVGNISDKLLLVNDELEELKSKVDIERSVLASAWESKIRAREEYLRCKFKESGESAHWYGAEWVEESADNVTAINSDGDALLHTTLPIQNKMRRCVMKNGIVQYYLDANNSELKEDGTNAKLDGTDGNVMVEIPEFFYRSEESTSNGIRTIRIKLSEQGLDGFIFSPKRYTSAYEATLDRSKNKLVSVCTTLFDRVTEEVKIEDSSKFIVGENYSLGVRETAKRTGFTDNAENYRGGTNDSTLDDEIDVTSQNYSRNQLGIPIANVNRTQLRSYADNDNKEFIYQYDTHKLLWILSMVEFKKKNIVSGTKSIGANVYPDYNAFETYFSPKGGISCLPCGITNSLGNKTGTIYYRMVNVPVESTISEGKTIFTRWGDVWMPCLSYRGVENWYGHIYKIADGVNILCEGTGVYYEGKEGNANYEYNNVTYWYQKNPYLTNDEGVDKQKLGMFNYLSGTQVITSILGGDKLHILPISADVTGYSTHYCDSVEIYHRGGMMYPAYNGRIVSNLLDGANFIVGNNLADNGTPRPSDGTRLDAF